MAFTAYLSKLRCIVIRCTTIGNDYHKSPGNFFHENIVVKDCPVKTSDDADGLRQGRSARLVQLSSPLNRSLALSQLWEDSQ